MSTFLGSDVSHRAGDVVHLALQIAALTVTVFAWASTAARSAGTSGPPETVAQLGD